jgi:hypothetical protein
MRYKEFNKLYESIKLPGVEVKPLSALFKGQQPETEVDEAIGLDAPYNEVPDEEMADYLGRVKADALRRDAEKKTSKTQPVSQQTLQTWGPDAPETRSEKEKTADYYTKPYIHASSIKFMADGKTIDVEAIKAIVKTRPKSILAQNKKMQKSGVYFNTSLPALKGLAVDEETNKFVYVNTCPGAGSCQQNCYVKGGFYIVFDGPWKTMSQNLNFLLNDPQGFEEQLSHEIQGQYLAYKRQRVQVNVRWHDAGDFFSDAYLQMAIRIAKRFPEVKFYCYSKMANTITADLPPNFDPNWSEGAKGEQRKIIKIHQQQTGKRVKHSQIVPREMFKGMLERVPDPTDLKGKEKMWAWKDGAIEPFKDRLAQEYNLERDTILTYDEMMEFDDDGVPRWNVIVIPGDPDTSANRRDVIGTYLLEH